MIREVNHCTLVCWFFKIVIILQKYGVTLKCVLCVNAAREILKRIPNVDLPLLLIFIEPYLLTGICKCCYKDLNINELVRTMPNHIIVIIMR